MVQLYSSCHQEQGGVHTVRIKPPTSLYRTTSLPLGHKKLQKIEESDV